MKLREARTVLGIGPEEDPRPLLPAFCAMRESLAAMVRDAPNHTLAMRHQEELVAFDRALAAVCGELEVPGLPEIPQPGTPDTCPAGEQPVPAVETESTGSLLRTIAVVLLLILGGTGGGAWLYWKYQDQQMVRFTAQIESLESTGIDHIENRRWGEAAEVFQEIERLQPGSAVASRGRQRIEAGISEEQSQFIGYWTGEARAALDSGRWDAAESAARKLLARFPNQPEAAAVLDGIADAKLAEKRRDDIANLTTMLDRGEAEAAHRAATALAATHPDDAAITELAARARRALARLRVDHVRANELFANARARDTGTFDAQVLEWLREAALLAPQDEAIASYLAKMASYTRTIRVPEDTADLHQAIAEARKNDRILLAAGTWHGAFVINMPIDLQGAGPDETVLECPALTGCALTLGPAATGARITGITMRHIGFDAGADRYSATLVRGSAVTFVDCQFAEASGHGLAVIEGGRADIQRCRFRENGWNGLAANGAKSSVTASECQLNGNFGHGAEAWDGAALALTECRIERNSGNGAHIDTAATGIRIESSELTANREYGIVLTAAAQGDIADNRVQNNLLGGIAVRRPAAAIRLSRNDVSANKGPGLVLDHGIDAAPYLDNNTITRNADSQILTRLTPTPTAAE